MDYQWVTAWFRNIASNLVPLVVEEGKSCILVKEYTKELFQSPPLHLLRCRTLEGLCKHQMQG